MPQVSAEHLSTVRAALTLAARTFETYAMRHRAKEMIDADAILKGNWEREMAETPEQEQTESDWLADASDNRCSISFFGSREAAQQALDSLKNCRDCTNCSGCSDCSRCSGCSRCSDCSDCSRCSYCSDCSGCSDCSRCSGCSDCSRCSGCSGQRNVQNNSGDFTPPSVPTIEHIHQRVYEAASAPEALDMGSWHKCQTTHCRAGWVVHLAGEAGYALARFHNTALAAQLIYKASSPEMPVAPLRFYEGNTQALKDMKRLAELEAAAS